MSFHKSFARSRNIGLSVALAIAFTVLSASPAFAEPADSGGATFDPAAPPPTTAPTTPGSRAKISKDGKTALAPADAPQEVVDAIAAANKIVGKPYLWGGGHQSFAASGYDCSGAVSYALHGAGLLKTPMASGEFMTWGVAGRSKWITVYTNPGHMYVVIAGLRFDTSGPGPKGPNWRSVKRSSRGFKSRRMAEL